MYHTSAQTWRKGVPRSAVSEGRRRRSRKEALRIKQLFICMILFFTVFFGKGVFPEGVYQMQAQLQQILSYHTDFSGILEDLGSYMVGQGPVMTEIGHWFLQLSGVERSAAEERGLDIQQIRKDQQMFLSVPQSALEQLAHYMWWEEMPEHWSMAQREAEEGADIPSPPEAEPEDLPQPLEPALTVGAVVMEVDAGELPLPEHHTMDKLFLGEIETATPVMGHLRSAYGYRDHPIDGTYKFHNGVDISGGIGTPIQAFASGTVDYIGENETYGLYFQLDHGNQIKSFYAHCSKLLVSKGQQVEVGQKVAEVGATGMVTGPHLHLELKLGELHLNPVHYLTFLSE